MKILTIIFSGLLIFHITGYSQTGGVGTSGSQPVGGTPAQPAPNTSTPTGSSNPPAANQPIGQPETSGSVNAPSNPYATQPGSNSSQLNAQPGNNFQRPETTAGYNTTVEPNTPAAQPSGGYTTKPSNSNTAQPAGSQLSPVQPDQMPTGLRETLQSDTYKGWDRSTIYYDRGSNQYSMDLNTGQGVKTYRFDESGKPMQSTPNNGGGN